MIYFQYLIAYLESTLINYLKSQFSKHLQIPVDIIGAPWVFQWAYAHMMDFLISINAHLQTVDESI